MKTRRLWVPMVAVLLAAAPAIGEVRINISPDTNNVGENVPVSLNAVVTGNKDGCDYSWQQTNGTPALNQKYGNGGHRFWDFTTPNVNANETLQFKVTVSGCSESSNNVSAIAIVNVINATSGNTPPTAKITVSPEEVFEGTFVTLDSSASSDPDNGDILSFSWEQTAGPAVTLSSTTDPIVTFTAPNDPNSLNGATLEFKLTVKDGKATVFATKTVTVKWFNDPPKAALTCTPTTVDEGKIVTLNGSGSTDSDDHIASFVWSQALGYGGTPVTLPVDTMTTLFDISAPQLTSKNNKMTFALKVTDNGELFDSTTCDVFVNDITPPVFSNVPANMDKVEATSAAGAAVNFDLPKAIDAVDGEVMVECTPATGATFTLGTTLVTCNAADKAGNKAETNFNITVQDTTPPLISAHADETAEATSAAGAVVNYVIPTATDLVDGTVAVDCTPASGSTFALGSTAVNCSATDTHNNAATAGFAVIVKDTTPPAISGVPGNITAEATGPAGAAVSYTTPTATDLVDGTVAVSCDKASGSTFALGDTPVTCSASDKSGNKAEAKFTVTVQDTTPPVIKAHADETAEATSASGAAVTYTNPATSDLVDGAGTATCTPVSGSVFSLGTTTVTCNATDKAGNKATATTFSVIVKDTTPPVIATHADETAFAAGLSGAIVNYAPPATSDIVDGAGMASCLPASGSTFGLGTTTVTCNATDKAGNKTTPPTSFKIAVIYKFNGLLSPYNPDKAYKIKSAIPIKWQYTSATGAVLPSATANPSVVIYQVTSGVDATDAIILDDAGASGYQYDSTTNTWQYNWKTTGLSAGTYNIYIQSSLTGQKDGPFKIQLSK